MLQPELEREPERDPQLQHHEPEREPQKSEPPAHDDGAHSAAALTLQRARRRAVRRRPANSTDPITLEDVATASSASRSGQPLFRYVDAAGVLTVLSAQALADYGLTAGELIHPLSRARLDACEVLRLEHALVGAGLAQYAGLAAQLSKSEEQLKQSAATAAADLSCLDHSYFMADVIHLLEQAADHQRHLYMRDTREASMSPYARRPCDSIGMQALITRLRQIQATLTALEQIEPTTMMNELAALAQTMEAIDLSRRTGIPCDPCTWPSELVRNEALMSMPGWAESEWGGGAAVGGEEYQTDNYDSGGYEQPQRTAELFSLEAALEASAAKQAQRSQNKKKKKGKKGKK